MKHSTPSCLPTCLRSSHVILQQGGASITFSNFGCPFLESIALTKFKTRAGIPRRHIATAKLTCGPRVAWLSVWASFGVKSIVWRNQICGAETTLGNSGLLLPGYCSLLAVQALGTGSSSLNQGKVARPVLIHLFVSYLKMT